MKDIVSSSSALRQQTAAAPPTSVIIKTLDSSLLLEFLVATSHVPVDEPRFAAKISVGEFGATVWAPNDRIDLPEALAHVSQPGNIRVQAISLRPGV